MNSSDQLSKIVDENNIQEEEVEVPKKLSLKQRKAARRAKLLIGKSRGRWSLDERREYYVFLKIYSQFFVSKDHRRNDKVYRMMANFIKSRTPDQCRTHHQKLQVKFNRISKILEALREQFGVIQFDQIVRKCDITVTLAGTPPQEKEQEEIFLNYNKNNFEWTYNDIGFHQNYEEVERQQAHEVVVKAEFEDEQIIMELCAANPHLY